MTERSKHSSATRGLMIAYADRVAARMQRARDIDDAVRMVFEIHSRVADSLRRIARGEANALERAYAHHYVRHAWRHLQAARA